VLHLQWSTLVFQLLNFVILLVVLGRFLYRPLMDAMRRREEAVTARVREADERVKLADAERTKLAGTARAAQAEAETLLARGRADAAHLKEEQQASARQETSRLLEEGRQRIASEERTARRRLAADARGAAVKIAGALIGKVAGRSFHEALVAQFFDAGLTLDSAKVELLRRALAHADGEVTVETAYPMPVEVSSRLEEALVKALGSGGDAVRVTVHVDPSLGAGFRLVVGVGVVDLSLRHTLADLERDAAALEP